MENTATKEWKEFVEEYYEETLPQTDLDFALDLEITSLIYDKKYEDYYFNISVNENEYQIHFGNHDHPKVAYTENNEWVDQPVNIFFELTNLEEPIKSFCQEALWNDEDYLHIEE